MSSGFITKVLSPLMTSSSATSSSTEKPLSLVEIDEILKTLLSQIDQRPLQFTERNNIQREIAKFMKINNIQPNSLHIQELSSRLSYTFFPSVSPSTNTSTTTKKIKSILENNTITKPTPNRRSSSDESIISTVVDSTGIDLDNLLRNKTHYCVCTLYRQRSPLSTSFKLCLEETRERDTSNGSFSSSSSKYEPSLVLLGARRSGAISSSFGYVIHSSFDPKNGRDKSGIGRIQRVSGSSGRYLSTSTSLKSYIAIHVSSKSMDKLLRVKAVALSDTFQSDAEEPLTSFSVTSDSLVSVSSATMTTDISPSKGRSGTESGSNSSGAKDITSEELWLLKSLDALVENKIESEIPLFSAVTEKIFTNDTQNHTVPSNSNHESSFQVLKLRSAAPRVRMNTESLKDEPKSSLRSSDSALYNTNFTSGFRAKEASRKNIVIESLQSAGDSVTAFDDEYCPVFQMGKISEDKYAVEFHSLSAYQAFSLALTVFGSH